MIPHTASQNEATLFFPLLNPERGLFLASEWLSQCHADLFQALTFPPWHGAPKHLVCVLWGGRGGGASLKMYKAWRKREQMAPSDKTRWIKEMRDESILFFSEALQLMSGQKVTVCIPAAPVRLKEPSQQQLSLRFHSAFILRCNYSGGLGALWALSGGATPSTASESVLSTISPCCAHYTFKKKEMMVFGQNTLSDYNLTLQLRNSSAPNQCLWLNTACRLLSEPAETSLL